MKHYKLRAILASICSGIKQAKRKALYMVPAAANFGIALAALFVLTTLAFSFAPQPVKQGPIKPATVQAMQQYIQATREYFGKRPFDEAAPYVQGAYQLQQAIEADLRDTTTH